MSRHLFEMDIIAGLGRRPFCMKGCAALQNAARDNIANELVDQGGMDAHLI